MSLIERLGDAAAHSAGFTDDEGRRGLQMAAPLALMVYNDFATWWDNNLSRSLVGKALGVRGTLPRLANVNGHPAIIRGPDPLAPPSVDDEAQQVGSAIENSPLGWDVNVLNDLSPASDIAQYAVGSPEGQAVSKAVAGTASTAGGEVASWGHTVENAIAHEFGSFW